MIKLNFVFRDQVCSKSQIVELYQVKEELKKLNVPIVVIGNGNANFAKAYLEDSPFGAELAEGKVPLEMYIDTSLKTYKALQMNRGVWYALKPTALAHAISEGKKHGVSQTWGSAQGDTWQQGGAFVLEDTKVRR